MRILLTGHTGYLGHHLVAALRTRGIGFVTGGRRDADFALDLDDLDGLPAAVDRAGVDVVLHAAATSAMGACAADPDGARRRNGDAVGALARGGGARVVMVSTDLVFDGGDAPYRSDDVPQPIGAYAVSKRLGEERALAAGGLVVRVPLMFGPSHDGRRGATDMLRAARSEGRELGLFDNEFRTPLHVRDAADALVTLALDANRAGCVHVAGPERVSRFELAERFARAHGLAERPWRATICDDPERPRDVSLVSDVAARSLDAMLVEA